MLYLAMGRRRGAHAREQTGVAMSWCGNGFFEAEAEESE